MKGSPPGLNRAPQKKSPATANHRAKPLAGSERAFAHSTLGSAQRASATGTEGT